MINLDERLSAEALAEALASLDAKPEDAAELTGLRERVLGEPELRTRVQQAADAFAALEGDYHADGVLTPEQLTDPLGYGVCAIFGLAATLPEALAWRPRQPRELALRSLSDAFQQIHINRLMYGELGLHNLGWAQENWAGGLVWLGRLQFNTATLDIDTPEKRAGELAWWIHIPQSGPLLDADACASVAQAETFMAEHYPHGAGRFYCDSWLLDPALVEILGPESNIGRFAARFSAPLHLEESDRDALAFGFLREPPVDLANLPRDTRLHRGMLERLESGGHFHRAVCRWEG